MNKQETQYYNYLINLGYNPIFNQEKSSFLIKEHAIYLKCCEYPASEKNILLAKEHSGKLDIVLLEGNLTFREYPVYREHELMQMAVLMKSDSKYAPWFFGEYAPEDFEAETLCISKAISDKKLVCKRCKKVDRYVITKNIHYKATCVCGSFITNVTSNKPITIHFGKYSGRELESMTSKEEVQYLQWALNNNIFPKKLQEATINFLAI